MVVLREAHSWQRGAESLAIFVDLLRRSHLISLRILFTSRPIIDFRRMNKFNQFSVNPRSKNALYVSFQETSLAVLLRLERGSFCNTASVAMVDLRKAHAQQTCLRACWVWDYGSHDADDNLIFWRIRLTCAAEPTAYFIYLFCSLWFHLLSQSPFIIMVLHCGACLRLDCTCKFRSYLGKLEAPSELSFFTQQLCSTLQKHCSRVLCQKARQFWEFL